VTGPDIDQLVETVSDAVTAHVPDGYDQVDLGWEGPLRRETLEALSELAARARETDHLRELEDEAKNLGFVGLRADRDRLKGDRDGWRRNCLRTQERLDERREENRRLARRVAELEAALGEKQEKITKLEADVSIIANDKNKAWRRARAAEMMLESVREALAGDGGGA
jgi:chromosome segregation ATPase